MTVEELKNRLNKVKELDDSINKKLQRLSELKTIAACSGAGAIRYDQDKVQTSVTGGKLENSVIAMIDLEHEIDHDTDQFIDYRDQIISDCRKVEDKDERDVLLLKYIGYLSIRQIAQRKKQCKRNIQYTHSEALFHLAALLC